MQWWVAARFIDKINDEIINNPEISPSLVESSLNRFTNRGFYQIRPFGIGYTQTHPAGVTHLDSCRTQEGAMLTHKFNLSVKMPDSLRAKHHRHNYQSVIIPVEINGGDVKAIQEELSAVLPQLERQLELLDTTLPKRDRGR